MSINIYTNIVEELLGKTMVTVENIEDVRWFGESNGYYSEEVDFMKMK